MSRNTRLFVDRNNSRLNRLERRPDEALGGAFCLFSALVEAGANTWSGTSGGFWSVQALEHGARQGRRKLSDRASDTPDRPRPRRVVFNRICLRLQRSGQDLAKRCSNSPPSRRLSARSVSSGGAKRIIALRRPHSTLRLGEAADTKPTLAARRKKRCGRASQASVRT